MGTFVFSAVEFAAFGLAFGTGFWLALAAIVPRSKSEEQTKEMILLNYQRNALAEAQNMLITQSVDRIDDRLERMEIVVHNTLKSVPSLSIVAWLPEDDVEPEPEPTPEPEPLKPF